MVKNIIDLSECFICILMTTVLLMVQSSINIDWNKVVDTVVQFLMVLYLSILSLTEKKSIEVSIYKCRFMYYFSFSISLHFLYFEVFLLGAYTFRILRSSRWFDTFIIMWCHSLSLVNIFLLKFTVINTVTAAFFWFVFARYIYFILLFLT